MLQIRLLGQFELSLDKKRVTIPSRIGQSLFAYLALTAGTAHRREKLAGMFWPDTTEETARKYLRQELWRIRKSLSSPQKETEDYLLADEFTIAFNRNAKYWLDVHHVERPDPDLESLTGNLSFYQGELLPGFYEEWVLLERERLQSVLDTRMGQLLEQLITSERWTAVQEQAERWLTLGNTPEPAFRALMLAYGARGDMTKVSSIYQRCLAALEEQFGIQPSAETRALYEGLLRGTRVSSRPSAQPSSTVTFLFTDIEGSTNLLDYLGNQYADVLETHHEIMRNAIRKWKGKEIDTQGDSFFVTFTRALNAVQCAAEMQRLLQSHPWVDNKGPRVRMGLHTGEPLIASTGYVGMDVHRAARIGDAAHGGQVLLSQTTRELVMQDLPTGITIRDLGEHRLKDLKFPTPMYQLVIEGLPANFPPVRTKFTGTEAPTPGEPPFKGLQYFDEADCDLFFGREVLTEKLMRRLHESQFLSVVIGASGSGKSSLVRAGLIPALRNGQNKDWQIHVITPTAHPLEALFAELTKDSESVTATATLVDDLMQDPRSLSLFLARQTRKQRSLLVIDQFEELFTLCRDEFEREAFIDNLLTALNQDKDTFTLVLTLRADFYAHLAQYPELREAVAKYQEYIGPMSMEELRRAIEEPAKRGHWAFEPGLVDLILRDVGDEPGALPLLSHALLETWKRRAGHTLTLKGYADAGGVHGAIAHTAEGVYQSLLPEEQAVVRDILLRLTELGEGTEDTRRRASFEELMSDPETKEEVRRILNVLAEARLITLSEDTAEVAHEALIREWPTLREWLNQDREGLQLHRRLTEAAREWEFLERDEGVLYRGAQLAQAREWATLHARALNMTEKAFIEASNGLEQREANEREAQRQRELEAAQKLAETQKNAASRLRIRNRVISLVGVIAVVLAAFAVRFGQQSNNNARLAAENAQSARYSQATAQSNAKAAELSKQDAQAQQRIAQARELAANAENALSIDPELSILLALQGIKITEPNGLVLSETKNALHRAIAASHIVKTINAHKGPAWAVVYSPNGKMLASGGQDGNVRVLDADTYEEMFTLQAHEGGANSIAFSPDGKFIATGGGEGLVKIWDPAAKKLLMTMKGHTDAVASMVYKPDGTQLTTLGVDNMVRIWDAATGQELAAWPLEDWSTYFSYSHDGKYLLLIDGSEMQELQIRDPLSGEKIHTVPVSGWVFADSPDGKKLAVISQDAQFIKVLDGSSFETLYSIVYPSNQIERMGFSPDGSQLAAVGRDRKVHIWDANNGIEILTLAGHNEFIVTLAFSPDGKQLASGSYDGQIKVWSLEPSPEVLTFPNLIAARFAVSPDGTRIAANGVLDLETGKPDRFQVWDLRSAKLLFEQATYQSRGMAVAFSPDGKEIAASGSDLIIQIRDASSGSLIHALPVEDRRINGIAYRSDGKLFAAVGTSGRVELLDRSTGKALLSWDAGLGSLSNVVFSPDGSQLAVVSDDTNDAKVFDATTGKEVLVLKGHTNSNWGIDYHPDGTRLVTAGRDATARVWDAKTGELLMTLTGHTTTIGTVHFSPDGTQIATGGADGKVYVWDTFTGQQVLEVEGYNASLAFTPDGKRLVISGDNRTSIKVIALTVEELVQIAQSRLTRSLTVEECQKYLHGNACTSAP